MLSFTISRQCNSAFYHHYNRWTTHVWVVYSLYSGIWYEVSLSSGLFSLSVLIFLKRLTIYVTLHNFSQVRSNSKVSFKLIIFVLWLNISVLIRMNVCDVSVRFYQGCTTMPGLLPFLTLNVSFQRNSHVDTLATPKPKSVHCRYNISEPLF